MIESPSKDQENLDANLISPPTQVAFGDDDSYTSPFDLSSLAKKQIASPLSGTFISTTQDSRAQHSIRTSIDTTADAPVAASPRFAIEILEQISEEDFESNRESCSNYLSSECSASRVHEAIRARNPFSEFRLRKGRR